MSVRSARQHSGCQIEEGTTDIHPELDEKASARHANAAHRWLLRSFPKRGVCERCSAEGRTDFAFRKHPAPYTRDRADYEELCRRCHMLSDGRLREWLERNFSRRISRL